MITGHWSSDRVNVLLTAQYMADEGYSAKEVARMLEKPSGYDAEYLAAVNRLKSECPKCGKSVQEGSHQELGALYVHDHNQSVWCDV